MDKTIVVIEDQEELRLLISLTLGRVARVFAEPDARALAALVDAKRPDLVILDVWLADGACGLDLCRQLKRPGQVHAPKVMILSACGQQSDIQAGIAAGADRYVVKPFSPEGLVEAATAMLAGPAPPPAVAAPPEVRSG